MGIYIQSGAEQNGRAKNRGPYMLTDVVRGQARRVLWSISQLLELPLLARLVLCCPPVGVSPPVLVIPMARTSASRDFNSSNASEEVGHEDVLRWLRRQCNRHARVRLDNVGVV